MELSEAERGTLAVIVGGKLAWSSAQDLASQGHPPEVLGALEAAGLVERWTLARELTWTLTPIAAQALEVELVEVGYQEDPRWIPSGQAPRFAHAFRQRGHYELKHPELLLSKAPGPDVLIDPETEDPLLLFGRTIAIDPRLRRKVERLLNPKPSKAKAGRRKLAAGNPRARRKSRAPRRRMVAC
ncbi:hypothetical protein [Singulisphaera sp. PoT]|uniref:hypothetical protein n=1 Tax=Singulisphaera sp. PoT TaxID=3411797 RepID=UPI003BF5704B